MFDLVEVVLHGTLVYMVQKNLVDNNHHHLMINNQVYNKVYSVYLCFVHYFYSVEKMDNFHFGLVKFVGSHESLLGKVEIFHNLLRLSLVLLLVYLFFFTGINLGCRFLISFQVRIFMIFDSAPESIKKSISRSGG